jgi:hypothetical protein
MRIPRWPVLFAALVAAAAVCGAAFAVGPWPGLAATIASPTGDVHYTASRAHGSTTVKAIRDGATIASARFTGAFGIPAVTSNGLAGGLSPDGRILVLAEPPVYQGLREQSRFLVVNTKTLSLSKSISLRGEFGFDAISPNRRYVYVTQHVSSQDLVRYVVRAYDLKAGRLVPGAIVDKREPDEAMRGYPIQRATSTGGIWVYTLYSRPDTMTQSFVHALNTASRVAFCIDLPRWPAGANSWNAKLALSEDGSRLIVRGQDGQTAATIDTRTLQLLQ